MHFYLLEDDNNYIGNFTRFAEKKWHSVTAQNSIDIFSFIEADVYLLDLQLWPDIYSYDIIKEIRNKTHKPIAMLTNHVDHRLLVRGIECWADYFFSKIDKDHYSIHFLVLEKMLWVKKQLITPGVWKQ